MSFIIQNICSTWKGASLDLMDYFELMEGKVPGIFRGTD